MGDVVELYRRQAEPEFVEPEQWVWECGCGEAAFVLHSDGSVECDTCGSIAKEKYSFVEDQ